MHLNGRSKCVIFGKLVYPHETKYHSKTGIRKRKQSNGGSWKYWEMNKSCCDKGDMGKTTKPSNCDGSTELLSENIKYTDKCNTNQRYCTVIHKKLLMWYTVLLSQLRIELWPRVELKWFHVLWYTCSYTKRSHLVIFDVQLESYLKSHSQKKKKKKENPHKYEMVKTQATTHEWPIYVE